MSSRRVPSSAPRDRRFSGEGFRVGSFSRQEAPKYPAAIYGDNEEIGGVLARDYIWTILRNAHMTGSVLGMWVAVYSAKVLGKDVIIGNLDP